MASRLRFFEEEEAMAVVVKTNFPRSFNLRQLTPTHLLTVLPLACCIIPGHYLCYINPLILC
jgi:hypothetical protein